MSTTTAPCLLVVDDDGPLRERLVKAFQRRGFEAFGAGSRAEALEVARQEAPELCVIDLRIGEDSGLALLRELLAQEPTLRALILTGYGSIATAVEAVKLGAENYLPKPADADDILGAFSRRGPLGVSLEDAAVPSLARAEWEHIHRVLADCEGNISEAARRLKIHRRSLQRKLSKYAPP